MNSVQIALLDLLRMSSKPLYSAHALLSDEIGHTLSWSEFFAMIQELIDRERLSLWEYDEETCRLVQISSIPEGIPRIYDEVGHTDIRYDPFGLTLALCASTDESEVSDWQLDIDFQRGTFQIRSRDTLAEPFIQLQRYFPDVEFSIATTTARDGNVIIDGQVVQRSS